MSSTLEYEPKPAPRKSLSYEMKCAILNRYDNFGSGGIEISDDSVEFLNGLVCAGLKEAQCLIDAINKHGAVKLYLSY